MKTVDRTLIKFLFVFLLVLSVLKATGQIEKEITATAKTSFNEDVMQRVKEVKNLKNKRYAHIVTTDIRNIGYGNICVGEATRKMGFTYVPMPINEVEKKSALRYFINNQLTRFKITLKHGPFWHKKLNKRVKECRQATGDITG